MSCDINYNDILEAARLRNKLYSLGFCPLLGPKGGKGLVH